MSKICTGERPSLEDQQVAGMKWINGLLRDNYSSFQQLRDGVVWCRLLNRIYPGSIRLKSVKQRSPSVVDWYANYHLLYASLKTLDISVDFSIRDLINGQDGEIVRAVCFFSDLYLKKKYRQRQKKNGNDGSKRKTTSSKLPQSQRTGFDLMPKIKSFFSFDKHEIDYLKLGEDSAEKNTKRLKEKQKKRNKFKNKQLHVPLLMFDQQNQRDEKQLQQQYEEQQDNCNEQQVQQQHMKDLQNLNLLPVDAMHNCNEQQVQQQHMKDLQNLNLLPVAAVNNCNEQQVQQQHMEDLQNLNLLPVAAVNKKLQSDQRYQENLIQMCIDLEKAELLMQRLWLQRRERRKMRHNLCDCSLSIGDQEQKQEK